MGSIPVMQSHELSYTDTTAVKLFTIEASEDKPVYVEIDICSNAAALSGGTPAVNVGTSTTATEWISAQTTLPAANVGTAQASRRRIIARTSVYAKVSGLATAGSVTILARISEINVRDN